MKGVDKVKTWVDLEIPYLFSLNRGAECACVVERMNLHMVM